MSAFSLPTGALARDAALIFEDRTVSFAELSVRGLPFAGRLPPKVAAFVAKPNQAALGFALRAIDAGVTLLPLHPRLTELERSSVLARHPAAHFFSDDDLERASDSNGQPSSPPIAANAVLDDEAIAAILLSSGTTGEPKGARLSRRAFAASARASEENLGWVASDRWLLAMPFSHAGGLSVLTRCLAARKPVVVHPSFDPERVIRSIPRQGITLLSVVPTMLASLLEIDHGSLSRLRAVLVGGAACPPDLLEACRDRSIAALTTYGLTETCSQVTTQRLDDPASRTDTDSGVALSGTEVRVVDGRVMVRGPTLMSGYVGHPDLQTGAWLDTGDRGALDERGRLYLSGRSDDLIVTGGENVSPVEVEHALRRISGVRDALVVGVKDPRWGQIVGALLVLDDRREVEGVLGEARLRMAAHKLPRRALVVPLLPLGRTGKPDRRRARELLES